MQVRTIQNLLAVFLTLSGLTLGNYVYDRYANPPERAASPAAASAPLTGPVVADSSAKTKTVRLPALRNFAEISDRPLFSATRRPPQRAQRSSPVVASAEVPNRASSGQYTVMGIMIEKDMKSALLRKGRNGEFLRVKVGQKLDGWTIDDIKVGSVQLRQGELLEVVMIRDNVLSPAELNRLKQLKRKASRRKKARRNLLRKNADRKALQPKRLARKKVAVAPKKPATSGRKKPTRRSKPPKRRNIK